MRAGRRILTGAVMTAIIVAAGAPPARAACRASENKAHSFDTRLTPVAQAVCRMTVEVFAGGSCGAPATWAVLLPCDQTANTAISNNGRLISILLPRTKNQDLNVIRVTWGPEKFALANLRKLAGASPLRGDVRIDFQGDNLRLRADRTLVMPFETVRKTISIVSD